MSGFALARDRGKVGQGVCPELFLQLTVARDTSRPHLGLPCQVSLQLPDDGKEFRPRIEIVPLIVCGGGLVDDSALLLGKPALGIESGHTSSTGGCDRLTIHPVGNVSRGKHTLDARS
jgi:hypothetical protein